MNNAEGPQEQEAESSRITWDDSPKNADTIRNMLREWKDTVRADYADVLEDESVIDGIAAQVEQNNGNVVIGRRGNREVGIVIYYDPPEDQIKRMKERFVSFYLFFIERKSRRSPRVFMSFLRLLLHIAEKRKADSIRFVTRREHNEYLNTLYKKMADEGGEESAFSMLSDRTAYNRYRVSIEKLRKLCGV